ncbi:MAG: HTH-type transcriptional regulator CdhR [Burkholderia plantarii]|nr:MAG: HTH-type transcriptional regulator CdhR [Burkholderia plantarii]
MPAGMADGASAGGGKPRFAFLLMDDFTLVAFAGFVDVLRLVSDAGDRSRRQRCDWRIVAETLQPVQASCGARLMPDDTYDTAGRVDYLVVVGGLLGPRASASRATLAFLARCAGEGATVIGLCTGVFPMVQAGLMARATICVSWFHYQDLVEAFPALDPERIVSDRLYAIDGARITCAGGRAAIDVAAAVLRTHVDVAHVDKALRILQVTAGDGADSPHAHAHGRSAISHPKLRRAILLIEQQIANAMSPAELARRVGMSVRHLERLFKEQTGMGPRAYAKRIRLDFAAWLLRRTDKPIIEIAAGCGFPSASHLSREFRTAFGMPPIQYRARHADSARSPGQAAAPDWERLYPDRVEFY